jgi:MtN3 and saliva related transmembrane protein
MKPEYIQYIGIAAGILTSVSMLPQIIKIFKEKKVEDISFVMILVLLTGIGGWIYYGILRDDGPIIYTNSFAFLLNATLLVLRFKYAKKNK